MATPCCASSPVQAQPEALSDLALAVFRLNGALLRCGDDLVAPLGLTSARWQMLGAIALAGHPLTAPQIGDAMGVTRQGAQKQLNLLRDQGLVAAKPNPAHQRSPLYTLTPTGEALYRQVDALWTERATRIVARIPAAHLRTATLTLDSVLSDLHPIRPTSETAS